VDFILTITEDEAASEQLPDIEDAIISEDPQQAAVSAKHRKLISVRPRKLTVKFADVRETTQLPIPPPLEYDENDIEKWLCDVSEMEAQTRAAQRLRELERRLAARIIPEGIKIFSLFVCAAGCFAYASSIFA
jgi:hypothetical protein